MVAAADPRLYGAASKSRKNRHGVWWLDYRMEKQNTPISKQESGVSRNPNTSLGRAKSEVRMTKILEEIRNLCRWRKV
jgi:hypothetical protein